MAELNVKVNLLDEKDEHLLKTLINPKFTNFSKGDVISFQNEDDGRSFEIVNVVHDINISNNNKVIFHELSLIVKRIV